MMDIPIIGIGTYRLDPATTYKIVSEGLKMGYRHIDTAALYRNEESVRKAIENSRISRDDIFVTTKITKRDIEKRNVRDGFLASLHKLGSIDLILLHCPTKEWKEGWKQLIELKREGLVRYIGVSNFSAPHLLELISELRKLPYCNQIELTPFLPRDDIQKLCTQNNIRVVSHSSLTKGYALHKKILDPISTETGLTKAQILLAWNLQKNVVILPCTTNIKHLQENYETIHKKDKLTDQHMDLMDRIKDRVATHPQWYQSSK